MKGINGFIKRLLNVIYGITLILLFSISILVVYEKRPIRVQDLQRSTINCSNGKKYSLETLGIEVYPSEDGKSFAGWFAEEERIARMTCFGKTLNREKARSDGYSDQEIDEGEVKFITDNKIEKNFKQEFYTKTKGNWGISLGWGILTFIIGYIVINLIQESLLYLFLAEKFTFNWLKKIIIFLIKKDDV